MSSRRDSRVHISVRQNDALLEFENFKRKYLLVNKHITKLNSTLSVRVEELNAQVSTLYVENLRLRASEIALVSQLKKEKEKTRIVVDEAENAIMEHLANLRTSLNISTSKPGPSSPPIRRKPLSPPVQPPREVIRLVRPPAETITQIRESDEEDVEEDDTLTHVITTHRPSASRLPLPRPAPMPQSTIPLRPSAIPHINLTAGATRRKAGRLNSSLLTIEHIPGVDRAPSSVAGLVKRPRRSSIDREDEEREVELEIQSSIEPGRGIDPFVEHKERSGPDEKVERAESGEAKRVAERPPKIDRKGKTREPPRDREREIETCSTSERDSSESSKEKERKRFGIKDVTNSPRKGPSNFMDEKPPEAPITPTPTLTTPSSMHTALFDTLTPKPSTSPLLSAASTPATDCGSEGGDCTTGRERRVRKSVNYAEPKLNTKMRKPDPPPESTSKPRISAGGAATRRRKSIPTPSLVLPSDEDGDADVEGSGSGTNWREGRRKTVHNAAVGTADPSSRLDNSGMVGITSGLWGDEGRRHSMAV